MRGTCSTFGTKKKFVLILLKKNLRRKMQLGRPRYRWEDNNNIVRFEVFTAVTMKNAVFWDVAPCRSCVNLRFGGIYRLHLQGKKFRELGTGVIRWLSHFHFHDYSMISFNLILRQLMTTRKPFMKAFEQLKLYDFLSEIQIKLTATSSATMK
jgi:hypothetical protein